MKNLLLIFFTFLSFNVFSQDILILNDKIDVAVTYWGLGEHELKGEIDYGDGDIVKLDRSKLDDSLVTLTIGFKF